MRIETGAGQNTFLQFEFPSKAARVRGQKEGGGGGAGRRSKGITKAACLHCCSLLYNELLEFLNGHGVAVKGVQEL